jgi:hypothetical protein
MAAVLLSVTVGCHDGSPERPGRSPDCDENDGFSLDDKEKPMTLFELMLLLSTAGISGYGFAAACGAVLERVGRAPAAQAIPATRRRR